MVCVDGLSSEVTLADILSEIEDLILLKVESSTEKRRVTTSSAPDVVKLPLRLPPERHSWPTPGWISPVVSAGHRACLLGIFSAWCCS
jgi:hypothetical protein